MTFDTRERSVATGRPIRLFQFLRGTMTWLYCTAAADVQFQGRTWRAMALRDDGIRLTGEASADALTITAPADLPVAQLFRAAPPSAEIWVTVWDLHHGEPDLLSSVRALWVGTVAGVRWPARDRSEIVCESLHASMDRTGLRLTWERGCPNTIYDHNCKLSREPWAVPATVQSIDGVSISSGEFGAFAAGYFAGGFLRWSVGGGEYEHRGVESHAGDRLVLLGGTHGLSGDMSVTAWPGCRQTAAYCHEVFANGLNYGGAEHMPGKSPYDGNPVF